MKRWCRLICPTFFSASLLLILVLAAWELCRENFVNALQIFSKLGCGLHQSNILSHDLEEAWLDAECNGDDELDDGFCAGYSDLWWCWWISHNPTYTLWRCRADSSNLDRKVRKISGGKREAIDWWILIFDLFIHSHNTRGIQWIWEVLFCRCNV